MIEQISTTETAIAFSATHHLAETLPAEAQALLKQVLSLKEFLEKIEAVRDSKNVSERGSDISGAIFEYLAYRFLQKHCQPEEVVLSPQETHTLYANPIALAPDPDGVKLRRVENTTLIVAVYEYTATNSKPLPFDKRYQLNKIIYGGAARALTDRDRSPAFKTFLGEYITQRYPQLSPVVKLRKQEYEPYHQRWESFIITPDTPGFPILRTHLRQIVDAVKQDLIVA